MEDIDQTPGVTSILAVEASYRIRLPQPLCKRVDWIIGNGPVAGWLIVGSPARCRLVSSAEADTDPDLQSLKTRIAEESRAESGLLEFRDEALEALSLRFTQIHITRHKTSGWRLTLPRHVAAIMKLRAGESDVAARLVQGHIEFWTIDLLVSSMSTPFLQII
jgi:hypothetical protein